MGVTPICHCIGSQVRTRWVAHHVLLPVAQRTLANLMQGLDKVGQK